MSLDFRSTQVRTNKVIASGSTGTNARLLVYSVSASSDLAGGIDTNKFDTATGIGIDVFMFVSGAVGSRNTGVNGVSVFGGDVVTSGSLFSETTVIATTGLSGSHTTLANGTSAFIAGPGIVIASQSNGAVTISGSVLTGSIFATSNSFSYTTKSVSFDTSGRYPDAIGSDVYFFVSGTSGSMGTADRGTAVFQGDMVVSGNFKVGSSSINLLGNEDKIALGNSYLQRVGSDLVFKDANNPTVTTLTRLINIGVSASVTSSDATPTLIYSASTTPSSSQDYDVTLFGKTTSGAYDYARYTRRFLINNDGVSTSLASGLTYAPVVDLFSAGAATWSFNVATSGSNVEVYVTGAVATNIGWYLRGTPLVF